MIATGAGPTRTAEIYSSIIAHADLPSPGYDFVATEEDGGHVEVTGGNNLIRKHNDIREHDDYQSIVISSDVPLLDTLANNGGPTLTHALLAGSPAIGQGSNPLSLANDQRGSPYARVVGGVADIGAFELQIEAGPVLPGDYNGNNNVDAADYAVWRMTQGTDVPKYSGADGNGDGTIDVLDYNVWRSHFGASLSGAAFTAVSEGSIVAAAQSPSVASNAPLAPPASKMKDVALLALFAENSNSSAARFKITEPDQQVEQRTWLVNSDALDAALLAVTAEQFGRTNSRGNTTVLRNECEPGEMRSASHDLLLSMDPSLTRSFLRTASLGAASTCIA